MHGSERQLSLSQVNGMSQVLQVPMYRYTSYEDHVIGLTH